MIFHIATAADWQEAQQAGEYRISTRGRTLEQQGFIHCSIAEQVAPVANAAYRGLADLLILVIDADRVRAEIRYEPGPGSDRPYPHIYGPLNVDAVVSTLPFQPEGSGEFVFNP